MPDIWGQAAILAKFLLYIGALGAAGLVIAQLAFASATASLRKRIHIQTIGLAVLALAAALLGFILRGAELTGGSDGMTDPEILGLLWQTPVGDALLYRASGAAIIIIGVLMSRAGLGLGQWLALVGALMPLWSFTQIGHIPDEGQFGLRLLLLLHLAGVAFWIGVLPPLHHLSRWNDRPNQAAQLGHQFGKAATIIVPALVIAGLIMGWGLTGSPSALIGTGYGQALLAKLAFVAVILTFAAANKLRFVPAMQAGNTAAARHLARSIQIETALILAVLATTATLTSVLTLPN